MLIKILFISIFLAGCATQYSGVHYEPIVDIKADQREKYHNDLLECQNHATKVLSAGESAAAEAVTGAILGALLMAAVGGSSRDGAWAGALMGGTSGAVGAEQSQQSIISNCLTGRGYSVLN